MSASYSGPGRRETIDSMSLDTPHARLRAAAREVLAQQDSGKGDLGSWGRQLLVFVHFLLWWSLALAFGGSHALLPPFFGIMLALSAVALMLGVQHEAGHKIISRGSLGNLLGISTIWVLGGSAISWRHEHNSHHATPNVLGSDPDLDTGGFLRFHRGQPQRPFHRLQHWYAPILYCLVFARWVWFEDIFDLVSSSIRMRGRACLTHAAEIVVVKSAHFVLFLVLPFLLWGDLLQVAVFYLTFMIMTGLVVATIVSTSHVGVEQDMFDANNPPPEDWSVLQALGTANFAPDSRLFTLWLGGVNYQIEHHLFPGVASRLLPRLQPVVKRWAAEEGIAYHEYPTLRAAIGAHFRHLLALGREDESGSTRVATCKAELDSSQSP